MGVYDYAVGGDAGWSFVFYPVDEPSSQYGGWVGVGDIEAAPSDGGAVGDIVLDRDNQGGMDAAVKRVYKANVFHYDADRVSSDMAKQGCWERHIVTRIVSYLNTRDRGLFLDVGADVGAFTPPSPPSDNERHRPSSRSGSTSGPSAATARRDPVRRRCRSSAGRCADRRSATVSLYKMGLADSFPGQDVHLDTNDEINRGNARMTPYFEGRRDFGQDKQKACMEVIYFEYQHDATVERRRPTSSSAAGATGYKLATSKNEEVGSFTPEQWDGMRGGDLRPCSTTPRAAGPR
ncbi:hypothetical protein JL720_17397 [Aureococcus anophagefferens]|nr:hypothetical protein JL720_17397 [Aureococcus anophagefferens]